MKKSRIDRNVVVLLITTLITMGSWVGFEVYRAYTENKVEPEVEKHLQQFDSTLKTEIFSKLEQLEP
jgi:hypothetical protein